VSTGGTGRCGLDAVVVGAGPNGLVAAAVLARAGLSVRVLEAAPTPGGGCRSGETTLPGFVHDRCAAVHPLGAISPAFAELGIEHHGVSWARTDVALAHPLDGGRAAAVVEDLEATAAGLGPDAGRYRRLLGPVVRAWDDIAPGALGPLLQVPRHPLAMASLGVRALPPAAWVSRHWFRTDEAAALWAGSAAHAVLPLEAPLTSAFAVTLHAAAHRRGWPVARGGSGRIIDALVTVVEAAGGRVDCDRPVRTLDDLPPSRVVLFDLALSQVAGLAPGHVTGRASRRLARFRHGPGSFKVDYALAGPVPWTAEVCRRATTVHVGGSAAEIALAEADVAAGRHPERPFVLVAQQDLADPSRVPDGRAQLWAYCHVPASSTLDMAGAIEAQIERFAPGFRDLVLARTTTTAAQLEAYNASYVGGDITGGSHAGLQLLARPYPTRHPYRLPWDGAFLCSASAPPGAGVHGMAGYHAAHDALRWLGAAVPGRG
jgi:phytoene dehydrogenase-like protein